MASQYKIVNGNTILQCKQCNVFKDIDLYYKHKEGFMGVLGRCKECIKDGRKKEGELYMARIRDRARYKNNVKRREYILKQSKNRDIVCDRMKLRMLFSNAMRGYKKPSICSVCYTKPLNGIIDGHHYDYNMRSKVIFCCRICHRKLDSGKIQPEEKFITDIHQPCKH